MLMGTVSALLGRGDVQCDESISESRNKDHLASLHDISIIRYRYHNAYTNISDEPKYTMLSITIRHNGNEAILDSPAEFSGGLGDRPSSSPGTCSLSTLTISVYGEGITQIRSNRLRGYSICRPFQLLPCPYRIAPRAEEMLGRCVCSQQIRMLPVLWYFLTAVATPAASSR
jgi:hypothetical protein